MARASSMPAVRGRGPVIAALAVIGAVVVVDILIAADRVAVTSLMIAAPLLCGITASERATVRIGALSVLAAAAAFIWGPALTSSRYWIPLGVVTLGSAFAASRGVEVGGDFYDLLSFDGGWTAIIGDVVGKGAEAAALTALARHTLAAIVVATGDVAYALQVLNRRLRERGDDYRSLCTVAAVVVTDDDRVTVISAGHPLPVLRRGVAAWPVGRPSPMLGYVDDMELLSTPVGVDPGDQIILYTDGVLDATGVSGRFGETRLLETARSLGDGVAAAHRILGAIDGFRESDQADDIAILSVARAPVTAARPLR